MRHGHSTAASLLAVMYLLFHAPAFAKELRGSYAANGQCYCLGRVASSLQNVIVPTPLGGQSISQICSKLGNGPGLEQVNGVYNFPVYQDLQCGHGPYENPTASRDADCSGTLDGTYGTCQKKGPKWNLNNLIGSRQMPAAALPSSDTSPDAAKGSDALIAAETGLELTDKGNEVARKVTENTDRLNQGIKRESPNDVEGLHKPTSQATKKPFHGRTVTIDGQRYLQARKGTEAKSGTAGSRIILDGLVFLRDDEFLDSNDLYRKPAEIKNDSRQASSVSVTKKTNQPSLVPKNQQPDKNLATSPDSSAARDEIADQSMIKAERDARESLMLEKIAREQALSDSVLLGNEASVKPETILDEVMRKNRRIALNDYWVAYEQRQMSVQAGAQVNEQQSIKEASSQVDLSVGEPATDDPLKGKSTISAALRLPSSTRASSRDFGYLEAMPASFDIGGNGIMLEGSAQSHERFQYIGRLGVTDTHRNVMLGAGYYLTPQHATRMTVVLLAGVEYGDFELQDDVRAPGLTFNSTDSGWHAGAAARLVISSKFELGGGLGYSSYFEGDAQIYGGGYYHVTPRLDIMSRFKFGDNDLLGIGIRYYY